MVPLQAAHRIREFPKGVGPVRGSNVVLRPESNSYSQLFEEKKRHRGTQLTPVFCKNGIEIEQKGKAVVYSVVGLHTSLGIMVRPIEFESHEIKCNILEYFPIFREE